MKYPILIISFMILGATLGHCALFEGWSWTDKGMFIAASAGFALDAYSTKKFVDKGYEEGRCDWWTGKKPDGGRLAMFTAAGMVFVYLVADWLPSTTIDTWIPFSFRQMFLGFSITNSLNNVRGNTIRCGLTWSL